MDRLAEQLSAKGLVLPFQHSKGDHNAMRGLL